ncbi:MAG: hypothetical protein CL878_04030 [Dehalococcoidia bacterium]|nr:hypothetical protein [Dehalococcoidia bacterium]
MDAARHPQHGATTLCAGRGRNGLCAGAPRADLSAHRRRGDDAGTTHYGEWRPRHGPANLRGASERTAGGIRDLRRPRQSPGFPRRLPGHAPPTGALLAGVSGSRALQPRAGAGGVRRSRRGGCGGTDQRTERTAQPERDPGGLRIGAQRPAGAPAHPLWGPVSEAAGRPKRAQPDASPVTVERGGAVSQPKGGTPQETRVPASELQELVTAIFCLCGMGTPDAALLAATLVWADLGGVHSHGVIRVPEYVEKLTTGGVDPRGRPQVLRDVGGLSAGLRTEQHGPDHSPLRDGAGAGTGRIYGHGGGHPGQQSLRRGGLLRGSGRGTGCRRDRHDECAALDGAVGRGRAAAGDQSVGGSRSRR